MKQRTGISSRNIQCFSMRESDFTLDSSMTQLNKMSPKHHNRGPMFLSKGFGHKPRPSSRLFFASNSTQSFSESSKSNVKQSLPAPRQQAPSYIPEQNFSRFLYQGVSERQRVLSKEEWTMLQSAEFTIKEYGERKLSFTQLMSLDKLKAKEEQMESLWQMHKHKQDDFVN